jgi:hypothetical protein
MIGTRMMRPSVMMFGMLVGILNSVASRLPACIYSISGPFRGWRAVIYIYKPPALAGHCTGSEFFVTSR